MDRTSHHITTTRLITFYCVFCNSYGVVAGAVSVDVGGGGGVRVSVFSVLFPPISGSGGGPSRQSPAKKCPGKLPHCERERECWSGPGSERRGRSCLGFNHQPRPLTVRWDLTVPGQRTSK